jgi:DNA polymerase I-like protein with 3'-5' exonuclease and polymerase domains
MKILFLGTIEDKAYIHTLGFLKQEGHSVHVNLIKADMLSEVAMLCKRVDATYVLCTQEHLIAKLCSTASAKEQKLANYAGSWLVDAKNNITYVFVHPLKQAVTKTYGQFLLERYAAKITKPAKWIRQDEFNWSLLNTGDEYELAIRDCELADVVSIDIETRPALSISSISYTCVFIRGNNSRQVAPASTKTYVVPLPYGLDVSDYQYRFTQVGRLNSTSTAKVLQNGKYDIAYFNFFGVPITNYLFDTAVCHHVWYAELPKALGTIAAFYLHKPIYWKHEGDSGNDYDLYRYNALDTWYTAWALLAWMQEAPQWATKNYLLEFPVLYPCILAEATGLLVNMESFEAIKKEKEADRDNARSLLGRLLGVPNFNPGSPKQVGAFMKAIGCGDLEGTKEVNLKKAAYRHPFNHYLTEKILDYRGAAKLVSTYLVPNKIFRGRILYSLTPYGTKTGRLSSQEHAFDTGLNIQNIPRTEEGQTSIKNYMEADEGFLIGECDYAQNESRTTGYITGDTVLIQNVDSDLDFHKSNASMFFGVPYGEVSKELRQLSKPVNHGKNYNMGDEVLVDTMGLELVFKAARLLKLPKNYTAKMIAAYLGKCFSSTYKVVSGVYPNWIKATVTNTRLLIGATGWTRYCFGNPLKSKMALNAYIAHPPQSLGAMLLNRAYLRIYNEVWRSNYKNFKLNAQIHDSNLFQYRIGHEYLADMVAACMINETKVTDIGGITRTLVVPVDLSIGGKSWQESKEH